jgi:hypothetical protein
MLRTAVINAPILTNSLTDSPGSARELYLTTALWPFLGGSVAEMKIVRVTLRKAQAARHKMLWRVAPVAI